MLATADGTEGGNKSPTYSSGPRCRFSTRLSTIARSSVSPYVNETLVLSAIAVRSGWRRQRSRIVQGTQSRFATLNLWCRRPFTVHALPLE